MPLPHAFWKIDVWADDSKVTLLTPAAGITRLGPNGVSRRRSVNQAYDYTLEVILADKVAAALSKGNYFEASNGKVTAALYFSGYIEAVNKTAGVASGYSISAVSGMAFLGSFINDHHLHGNWGLGFHNLLQFFNGINPVGSPTGINQKGILSGTGISAKWVDGTMSPAGSTTTTGTQTVNATDVNVVSSAAINITNRAVQIGTDWYGLDPTNPNPTATTIRVVTPGLLSAYVAGTTVKMAPYKLPLSGASFYASNTPALGNILSLCKVANVMVREADGYLAHNGVLEIGPLADSSGLAVYGGEQLASLQSKDVIATSHHPNVADAQTSGTAVIESVLYSDNLAHVINVVWPYGHGKGDSTRQIKTLMGSDPPGNGWATYTPYTQGRAYYLKTASATPWSGNTYEYICFQRSDGLFQYGVINRGANTGVNQAPPYGIHETATKDTHHVDPTIILEGALGAVEYNADPLPTYTLQIRHPQTSASGVPVCPKPGQTVDVRFTGEVHNAIDISSTAGQTYGQYVDVGSYRYMKIPTIADPNDENGPVDLNKVKKMVRVVQVEDHWVGETYLQTLVMGAGHWQSKHWQEALARDMESKKHEKDPYHSFSKHPFDKIPFYFSNSPAAWEDPNGRQIRMTPGSLVISDINDTSFFSDHHSFAFTFTVPAVGHDTSWTLDFQFGRNLDGTLTSATSSGVFAIYRIAGATSGNKSGFFTTIDGNTVTARGGMRSNPSFDQNRRLNTTPGTFRLHVRHVGNKFSALVTGYDSINTNIAHEHIVSVWNDTALALNKYGAIGWSYHGGSENCAIYSVHAQPVHAAPPPKKTIGKGQFGKGTGQSKVRRKTTTTGGGGGGSRLGTSIAI